MKILIADDHPFTLQGTKSFVESYGYKVTDTCSNGVSALNLIQLHTPEIAILDINMPGLDGLDVAKKVQESKLKTKVILLTMHKEMTIYKKVLAAEALDVDDGEPEDLHAVEGLLHGVELLRLDDGEDEFHGCHERESGEDTVKHAIV